MTVGLHQHSRIPGKVDPTLKSAIGDFRDVADLICWYGADSLSLNNNDAVGSVTDQSGNGNTGAASGVVFKTNIENGLPAFYFNSGNYIDLTNHLSNASGTWFIVWERTGYDNSYLLGVDGGTYSYLQYGSVWYGGGTGDTIPADKNTVCIRAGTCDGVNTQKYEEGALVITDSAANAMNIFTVGSGGGDQHCYIFEVAFYNRVLTQAEILKLTNIYKAKYGVTIYADVPSTISDLNLWMAADAYTKKADQEALISLRDLSGFGSDFIGSGYFYKNMIGSLPGIRYKYAETNLMYSPYLDQQNPFTLFAVYQMVNGGVSQRAVGSYNQNYLLGNWNGSMDNYFAGSGFVCQNQTADDYVPHIFSCTQTGSLCTFWRHNTQLAQNNNGVTQIGQITLGGYGSGEYSDVIVYELMMFNRVLSGGELSTVRTYAIDKWSLTS